MVFYAWYEQNDYSRTQEDFSQDEEHLSFREFWLGEHGCKCIMEWLELWG